MRESQKAMKELKKEGEALNIKQAKGLLPKHQEKQIIKNFNRRQWKAFVASEKDRKVANQEASDRHIEEVTADVINSTFNHPVSVHIALGEKRHKEIFGE